MQKWKWKKLIRLYLCRVDNSSLEQLSDDCLSDSISGGVDVRDWQALIPNWKRNSFSSLLLNQGNYYWKEAATDTVKTDHIVYKSCILDT